MTTNHLIKLNDKMFKPYITRNQIDGAVEGLANQINIDYEGKSPLFLVVLNGSIIFAADLVRHIKLDCELEALAAKSYGNEMQSSGRVELTYHKTDFKDRDLIIVEDIVDTGLTLATLMEELKKFQPRSIEAVSLLSKPEMRVTDVDVKYVGIEIPAAFVVGYGLDYAGRGRQLPEIYVVAE